MKTKLSALMFSLCALSACAGEAVPSGVAPAAEAPLGTIAALDVPRYMGRGTKLPNSRTGSRKNASAIPAPNTVSRMMAKYCSSIVADLRMAK